MAALYPQEFTWDGEAMVPRRPHLADRQYVVGETYRLGVEEERSRATHNHYFAAIHDAWMNLPEDKSERFPTEEHLRKWALVRAGYRDERTIVCASKAEAQRMAAFMKPLDDYAVIVARENIVVCWTAKSQSVKAMGKKAFQESKQAVLDILAGMIGTTPAVLAQNAAQAA